MVFEDFNDIPSGKYDIIYADPPWRYGGRGGSKWKPASTYYNVMTFEELSKFDISRIAQKDSLLFMWVVSSAMLKCCEVAKQWGYKYITVAFVWHKRRANVGNYTMSGCELCLLFKRGKIPKNRCRNPGVKQFYEESVVKHSKKPDEFRKRIEDLFPTASRIELFARNTSDGWDAFGNEVT